MLARSVVAAVAALALAAAAVARADVAPAPTTTATTPQPQPQVTFVVSGHGWGHGIGMSQWGARGYAEHGWGYRQILRHYYPGTQLGLAPRATIRVLLTEHRRRLTISSTKPFHVRDATGALATVKGLSVDLTAKLAVPVVGAATPRPLQTPLVFAGAGAPLALDGKPYRGTLRVDARAGKLDCIETVGVDAYVSGVVSLEMPHDWPAEAQKAQAVAARSYALATIANDATLFDVFADTRSQVYGGIRGETPEGDAAVAATAGQVVLYRGKVATTYFFSSSGGRTADVQEQWPKAGPVPYLVPVVDPYDVESPHHDWGPVAFTAQQVKKKLKLPALPVQLAPVAGSSGRATEIVATDAAGVQTMVPATDFRFGLGLDSTWVQIGELELTPPAAPLPYGQPVQLVGAARGVRTGVQLEQRGPGSVWTPLPDATVAADGSLVYSFTPTASGVYRLAAGAAATAPVAVRVVPRVTLELAPTGLTGSVVPPRAGVTVKLEPLAATAPAEAAQTDATGAFAFPTPAAGSYRASALGGASPPVVVP